MAYSCWLLVEQDRDRLLEMFPPAFPDVIAHHVTECNPDKAVPSAVTIIVLGEIIDPSGVQVLLVEVREGNEIRQRPKGQYHITWSIDREAGKKPFSSNATISDMKPEWYTPLIEPVVLATIPALVD